jgi:hypothetical protein
MLYVDIVCGGGEGCLNASIIFCIFIHALHKVPYGKVLHLFPNLSSPGFDSWQRQGFSVLYHIQTSYGGPSTPYQMGNTISS